MDEIDSIGSSRLGGGSGGKPHPLLTTPTTPTSPLAGDSEVQRTMLETAESAGWLRGYPEHQGGHGDKTELTSWTPPSSARDELTAKLSSPLQMKMSVHSSHPNQSNPPIVLQARLDILRIHSRKMNLTRGINMRKIAEVMPGASGAEVKVQSGRSNTMFCVSI